MQHEAIPWMIMLSKELDPINYSHFRQQGSDLFQFVTAKTVFLRVSFARQN